MTPFMRFLYVFVLLLLSGCSTYHPSETDNLRQLAPHYVTTKQGQIEYYRAGQGTPIVLIPGYATDVSSWNREFLAALAMQHQIIILNNRDVGGSHTLSTSYESKDLANDTYQLIQQLKLKKPTIIGISMGGMIAQQFAVLHPKSLSHLVLINTAIAGKQSVRPTLAMQNKLQHIPTNKLGFYLSAVDLFFPSGWKKNMSYSLIVDRFQPRDLKEVDIDAIMLRQQNLVEHWLNDDKTAKKIQQLQIPVLILNGTADIIIPPINSIVLANTIPHAKLVRFINGGHAMIYQFPKEMANQINHFIA